MALLDAQNDIAASTLRLQPANISLENFTPSTASTAGSGVSNVFQNVFQSLIKPQQDAMQVTQDFAAGLQGDLHKTMLTLEKADLSLKFFVSLRNKALEAYREIMHMGT